MNATMSVEMDRWLADARDDQSVPRVPRRGAPVLVGVTDRDLDQVAACPLTESEIDWLWAKFQRLSFPPATFAKRFARTERASLTARGKNAAVKLSYRYRRQIFGKAGVKMAENEFLSAVRVASERARAKEVVA